MLSAYPRGLSASRQGLNADSPAEGHVHLLDPAQGQSCRAQGSPLRSCCLPAQGRCAFWGTRPGLQCPSELAAVKGGCRTQWALSPASSMAPFCTPSPGDRWALPGARGDAEGKRQGGPVALVCRWRRPGTTCCCGRSWRPPSGQALRRRLPPPVKTPNPTARPAPPPLSLPRAGHRLWRFPTRGSGSWL